MTSLWISLPAAVEPAGPLKPGAGLVHMPLPASMRWRFYRRRALAVVAAGSVLLAASGLVGVLGQAVVQSPGTQLGRAPQVAVVEHHAEPGETLWSLAVALGPAGDVRESLDQLTRLNGGSGLIQGQVVRVPRSWFPSEGP